MAGTGLIFAGILGLLAIILTFSKSKLPSPIVVSRDGQLQGRVAYSRSGKEYFEYLSIPYAEPPDRFEPAQPVKPWQGIKQANKLPPYCAQFDGILLGRFLGEEDCLYLNVFTSFDSEKSKDKKPVMVWIHGGGFVAGASVMYGPEFFMDEEVVLITINYRLGVFGFLNSGDELVRGNMGLKDQTLALKWVQRNIDRFGGDPNRVTLFGESAGGASVGFHVISKASRGLFHRAITQSGSVTAPWALTRQPRALAFKHGKQVGCPIDNSSVLVDCMRKMNWRDLVKPVKLMMNPLNEFELIKPSVETIIKDDTFLTEDPIVSLKAGRFAKVPLLTGATSGEGGIRSARLEAIPELIAELDNNWKEHIKNFILFDNCEKLDIDKIRDFYLRGVPFTAALEHNFMQKMTDMVSDAGFIYPVRSTALLHAKHAPTYLYLYEYYSNSLPKFYTVFKATRDDDWLPAEVNVFISLLRDLFKEWVLGDKGPQQKYGISHADDLLQLFTTEGALILKSDEAFSKKFVKLFVDFASHESPLKFEEVIWPALNPKADKTQLPQYMHINANPQIISEPFSTRMEFWDNLQSN